MRKRWLISAVLLGSAGIPAAGAGAPMTDDTVVQMLQNGFGPDVIIARIKTSITAFDVSDNSLIDLKKNNVPDSVIAAMISAGSDPDAASVDAADPSVAHKPGFYVLNNWVTPQLMIVIESQTSKAVKTTNGFGAFMLGPLISPMQARASFDGPTAKVHVNSGSPTFYVYFNKNASSSDISSSDSIINSPDDFTLVRLIVDHNARGLTVGKFGGPLGGNSAGVAEKERVAFTSKQISNYSYSVTPDAPLAPGEYAFVVGKGEGHALKAYPFAVSPDN